MVSTEFSTGMIATLFQRLTKPSLMQNSKHSSIDSSLCQKVTSPRQFAQVGKSLLSEAGVA